MVLSDNVLVGLKKEEKEEEGEGEEGEGEEGEKKEDAVSAEEEERKVT